MKVIKRNGKYENFDKEKLGKGIYNAASSVGIQIKNLDNILEKIIQKATDYYINTGNDGISAEKVQDFTEEELAKDYFPVAKAYILYREKHRESRFIRERLDYMDEYSNSDSNAATSSETDANANVTIKNIANLEGEVYKTTNRIIQRHRMKDKLNEMFPEVAEQYEKDLNNHIIYAHDEATSACLRPYCMAATLYPLMVEGTGNIDGVTPSPPNDIQSFSGQVTNLIFLLSSQVRGAVALGDYTVALNYYVVQEFGIDWYKKLNAKITVSPSIKQRTIKDSIRKGMKQFIYGINQPAGNRSYNSPFSNLTYYDKYYFEALFENFYYPDGTKPEWEAINCLQRIFMELHRELRLIKPLTFPVTTMALLYNEKGFLDKEYADLCAEEWAKGGSFFCYMSNNPTSLASCCRVLNEIQDNTFNSTIGLTGIMTGSANVITLNINRIVQDYFKPIKHEEVVGKDLWNDVITQDMFVTYLISILERVYKYQIAYKTMLYEMEDKGMYSCSNANYIRISKLYSTIGFIGYCEAAQFLGLKISDNPEYKHFLQLVLGTIKKQNKLHNIRDKKRPFLFNSEAVPGESLAVKLYEVDKKDRYTVPENQNLYSSYFFLQWDNSLSIFDKLKLHNKDVNTFCDGGLEISLAS